MVSVRRPTPRGGGGRGGNKCIAYGKYVVLGGIVVLVGNAILSRGPAISNNRARSSIFEIEQKRQKMLRENHESDSRRTPPNFVAERLERRQHEAPQIQRPAQDLIRHKAEEEEKEEDEDEDHKEKILQQQHEHSEGQKREHKQENIQKKEPEKKTEEESKEQQQQKQNNRNDEHKGNRISEDEDSQVHHQEDEETEDKKKNSGAKEKIQYVAPNGDVLEKPEGTGPTKLGYVMDFVYERSHPRFRNEPIAAIEKTRQKHAEKVAKDLSESSVKPCEYTAPSKKKLLQRKLCRDSENDIVVYNAAPFPRSWCGTYIPSQSAARMKKHCTEPVHLFEVDFPPVSGQGMSPIVLHSQADGAVVEDSLEDVTCSIPCKMEKDMTGIGRYIQGTDWKIFHSKDDPNTFQELQVELSKFKHDEYFSTTYFKSDIPLSFVDLEKHNLRNRPATDFDTALDKASYIVNENCGATGSRRTRWFERLKDQYHIDALGICNHNTDLGPGESLDTMEGRLKVAGKYKFNMGFEASSDKDRLTELSYEAMMSGAVPILLGPPNAKKHFPRNSAIFASDFNHYDKLATFINEVSANKTLWGSFHKWRNDEAALAAFEQKYQFTKISPECRMCSWAYAKMYGLGWDHEMQQIRDTYMPKELCFDEESGLVAMPFQEIWSVASTTLAPKTDNACKTMSSILDTTLQTDGNDDWKIVKSVVQHDGVTDIAIREVKTSSETDEITLTFQFKDVNNTEGAFFHNSHSLVTTERGMLVSSATIQDHRSKVTVLANWETNVWSPRQGLIQVVVQCKDTAIAMEDDEDRRRIRVITEDMGQLHDKMTEYFPSSFSKRLIQDFVDPLEVFYVDS